MRASTKKMPYRNWFNNAQQRKAQTENTGKLKKNITNR
jgi:hypothetical protein